MRTPLPRRVVERLQALGGPGSAGSLSLEQGLAVTDGVWWIMVCCPELEAYGRGMTEEQALEELADAIVAQWTGGAANLGGLPGHDVVAAVEPQRAAGRGWRMR